MKKPILQLMAISFVLIVLTLSLASSYDSYYDNKIRLSSNSLNQYKYDTDNQYYGYMNDYYNNYYGPRIYYSDYDGEYYIKQRNYYRPYYYNYYRNTASNVLGWVNYGLSYLRFW